MKRFIAGFSMLCLSLFTVLPAVSFAGSGLLDLAGGRIVSVFHYAAGIMTSVFDKDNSTYTNFVNGMMMTKTLGTTNGPVTFTATYTSGKLTSSVDQYGDTTKYDVYGKQTATTHTTQDYDNDGNATGATSQSVTSYSYDQYGRMSGSASTSATGETQSRQTFSYDGSFLKSLSAFNALGAMTSTTHFMDSKASYVTDGNGKKIMDISYNGVTGRRTDTLYNPETGVKTGNTMYDQYNRPDYTTDMDNNITNSNVYVGAMLTQSVAYLNPTKDIASYTGARNITSYDQWGNQQMVTFIDAVQPASRTQYDPWTVGTLENIDGELCLVINPGVNGGSFYTMDPSIVAGDTQKTADGKLIFKINCDNDATEAELWAQVGNQANIMWQFFSKADENGFAWIHLADTSNGAVAYHLENDNASLVEKNGGTWDRSQQYVIF